MSCFRWKNRKNSYTVNHDDEYSSSGGNYTSKERNWASKGKTTNGNAVNDDIIYKKPPTKEQRDNDANIGSAGIKDVTHTRNTAETKTNYVAAKENYDVAEAKMPSPQPSPPPSPKVSLAVPAIEVTTVSTSDNESRGRESPLSVQSDTAEPMVIPDPVFAEPVFAEPVIDVHHESDDDVRVDYSVDVPVAHVIPTRDSTSSEEEREDPVEAREQFLAHRVAQEDRMGSDDVIIQSDYQVEDVLAQEQDILNSQEDLHITDSPAGTWDARLNKDVRAELDDQSHTSSTLSLEHHGDAIPVQRVQFDVPETDEEDVTSSGVAVISVTNETIETHDLNVDIDNDIGRTVSFRESDFDIAPPPEPVTVSDQYSIEVN